MTQPASPPPDKSWLDKLKELLPTFIVTGGGGYSLYCLVTDEIPKALISLGISAAAAPLTGFWEGWINTIQEKMKARGQRSAEAADKLLDTPLELNFQKQYLEALKTMPV